MKTKVITLLILIFSLSFFTINSFATDDAQLHIINQSGHKIRIKYDNGPSNHVDQGDINSELKSKYGKKLENGEDYKDGVDNDNCSDYVAYVLKVQMLKTDGNENNENDWVTVMYAGVANNIDDCDIKAMSRPDGTYRRYAFEKWNGAVLWYKPEYEDVYTIDNYGSDKGHGDSYASYIINPEPI